MKRTKTKVTKRAPAARARDPKKRAVTAPSHIVGVGGSAGSLEPLERFFRKARKETTMSFIVVTHRDPRSKGMMAEILGRATLLPVREPVQGEAIERGVVYVVPSDRYIGLRAGRIELCERPLDARSRTPIDSLFRAIALDRREHAIGVVLSGMGSDGTVGLAAIKENLGLAFVQDPMTAAYDAMPESAIRAGLADFVGTPEMMAEMLEAIGTHAG